MSILIKRYPNRKLYDTVQKTYITLSGIRRLVHSNQEIKVVDNVTGDDITAVVLSQVFVDNERRNKGFLSHCLLSRIIKSVDPGNDSVEYEENKSIASFLEIDQEITRRVYALVEQGEISLDRANDLIHKLVGVGHFEANVLPQLESILQRLLSSRGIATKADYLNLSRQVNELSEKIDHLVEQNPSRVD